MAERSLDVYIDRTRVCHLRERDGIWAFEYSPEWLAEPLAYPIGPALPLTPEPYLDGATERPVQ